ncbi:MAG TPA: alpha-galactosidase, partial [Armatimonadota bacterium]|nr:alpha-galactosidase [Armatimonadota bacterium]
MRTLLLTIAVGGLAVSVTDPVAGVVSVTREELAARDRWAEAHLGSGRQLPFSFTYGGRSSTALLAKWPVQQRAEPLDGQRTRHTTTWTDPDTGLVVRRVSVEYRDFPTVEWTVYFRNDGAAHTPIIEDIQALDVSLDRGEAGEYLLHHAVGSPCAPQDYQPLETVLGPGAVKRVAGADGRPTSSDLCHFNLELPGRRGMIVAVGWPGQWASEWVRDAHRGLRVRVGQELTHFRLLPGEEVRTPLMALQFWQGGDWLRAQNIWRRWFIAHNLHRPGGKLPPAQWCGASLTTNMMVDATEENQKEYIDAYLARGFRPDFWWMDAGWYPCHGDWTHTGTWEPDPARFPKGLRPVTDYLHERGIRSILWFEPERVRRGTWLADKHPEWVLWGDGQGLLDLGNPAAWEWLVDHVDRLIVDANVDIYRQDLNIDTLWYWRSNDAPDRQGITEIRHVTGLLAYWDELLRRHPSLLYDNCAGGGRRNDLESMRRGVPYTKSDYADDPVAVQGQTYGISMWIPYFAATWGSSDDPYLCRSRMAHVFGECLDPRVEGHLSAFPERLQEWRRTVRCYWGDFWPL